LRVETKLGGGDPVIEKKLNWCVVSAVIIHESTGLACSDGGMASQIAEMIGAAFNDGFRNFPTHSHGDRALSLSLSLQGRISVGAHWTEQWFACFPAAHRHALHGRTDTLAGAFSLSLFLSSSK
jgi:hypothetical protein